MKKVLFFTFVLFQVFSLSAAPALAGIADYSPEEVTKRAIDKIMELFGGDSGAVEDMVSSANVMQYKTVTPQVQISFNPPNPKPGERITATAIPTSFSNSESGAYFTWYLSRVDEDGDREEDSDDMKEIAAKIMANGGLFDNESTQNQWEEDWEKLRNEDSDDDGYKALFGGESATASKDADDERSGNAKGAKHCYAHDFETGINHEIKCEHQFPEGLCEDDDFSDSSEEDWETNPYNEDTDGDGTKDEADLCGLNQRSFTWNYKPGDKIGVIVEGTSSIPTKYADSSYMIFWALPRNSCNIGDKTKRTEEKEASCSIEIEDIPDFIETFNDEDECLLIFLAREIESFLSFEIPSIKIQASLENITLLETDAVADIVLKIIAGLTSDLGATYPSVTFADISNDLTHLLEDMENGYTNTFSFEIDEGEIDYVSCLVENLVSPTESNSFSKMDVSLSYKPESPLNGVGQELTLDAFISNADDLNKTKVTWSFEACGDIDSDCVPIPFSEIKDIGKTVGFGLTSVSLPLDIDSITSSRKYLKVTARATITFSANASNSGTGVTYIPLSNSEDQIQIYSAKVENGNVTKEPYERCADKEDPCLVTKGETLWLESPDNSESYSWIVDGVNFSPESCNSGECKSVANDGVQVGSENTNIAYFTVTKGTDQIHKVNLIAENSTTGLKIDILKNFKVFEPEVKIKPQECEGENPARIILGMYKGDKTISDWCINLETDPDESKLETSMDYSENTFFAEEGASINLEVNLNISDNGKELQDAFWTIDGIKVTSEDTAAQETTGATIDGNKISFIANIGEMSDSHTVSFAGYYSENSSSVSLSEKLIGDTIEIKVIPKENLVAAGTTNKILATIFTGLPTYLFFLFKITLLTALMLFISWIMSSLSSNLKSTKN